MKTVITKDELAALPLRSYGGPICLVSTADDLKCAREDFGRTPVVGLDTETRPCFRVGERHLPDLVQVALPGAVYLFRLKRSGEPSVHQLLTELLENPEVIKTGIGLAQDFKLLRERFPFQEKNVVDLSAVAKRQGLGQTGVRNLAGMFLGFRISKGQKTTNWSRPELTKPQILYAATDAWVCLNLYHCFQEKGFIPSRSSLTHPPVRK